MKRNSVLNGGQVIVEYLIQEPMKAAPLEFRNGL